MVSEAEALEMKKKLQQTLLNIPGVAGVGSSSGSGQYINIYAEQVTPNILKNVPSALGGIPVRVIESGRFTALQDPKARLRPFMMGVSIGIPGSTTGTAGCVCYDNAMTGRVFLLTNNHVIAGSDSKTNSLASRGDRIIQPGPFDGGTPADIVGTLERWVELDETGTNYYDAAVARVDPTQVSDEILGLGKPQYVVLNPKVNWTVKKSGRTSGITAGRIIDINATIKIYYPGYINPMVFDDVIITSAMAIPGDSGSAALTSDGGLVGLVFAGTPSVTAIAKMPGIMGMLDINFAVPLEDREPKDGRPVQMGLPLLLGGLLLIPMLKK